MEARDTGRTMCAGFMCWERVCLIRELYAGSKFASNFDGCDQRFGVDRVYSDYGRSFGARMHEPPCGSFVKKGHYTPLFSREIAKQESTKSVQC